MSTYFFLKKSEPTLSKPLYLSNLYLLGCKAKVHLLSLAVANFAVLRYIKVLGSLIPAVSAEKSLYIFNNNLISSVGFGSRSEFT